LAESARARGEAADQTRAANGRRARSARLGCTVALLALRTLCACAAETEDAAGVGYTPRFRTTRCSFDEPALRCGFLDVPERRSRPEGRQVSLFVQRLAARVPAEPALAPVVVLTGGPGGIPLVSSYVESPLRERRELVLLHQRGTGFSEPKLGCGEIGRAQQHNLARSTDDPVATDALVEATAACRDRLALRGIDVSAYDSEQNAHDVEDLRVALGVASWNLLGLSYGTRLALEVMRLHPEGARSAILAGTLPPQVDFFGERIANVERALGRLFDACEADAACPAADPRQLFLQRVEELDELPEEFEFEGPEGEPLKVRLDGGMLAGFFLSGMYDTTVIPELPWYLAELGRSEIRELAASGLVPEVPRTLISDSEGLYLSVRCREEMAYAMPPSTPAPRHLRAESFELNPLDDQCAVWDAGTAPERVRQPVESDVPTLLIAGELDPVTLPEWSELAAETLSVSRVLHVPAAGHDASDQPCAQRAIEAFLDRPGVDPGEDCSDVPALDFAGE
jgi:pimeloyl-ACP methyl ester carboxylesterase